MAIRSKNNVKIGAKANSGTLTLTIGQTSSRQNHERRPVQATLGVPKRRRTDAEELRGRTPRTSLAIVSTVDTRTIHPLLPDTDSYDLEISVVFGTYNRRRLLEASVQSIHEACRKRSYEIVVSDGGSTDGSRQWLSEHPNVVVIDGDLSGAVKAFNAAARISRGRFIVCLNDDAILEPDAIENALRYFDDPMVGQVAMTFFESKQWKLLEVHGQTYANFAVTRSNIVRAVEKISGGMWAACYYTYGGDSELSCWVRRLGYEVKGATDARVRHSEHRDDLRNRNVRKDKLRHQFARRWPSAAVMAFRGPLPTVSPGELSLLAKYEAGELPEDREHRIVVADPPKGSLPPRTSARPERVLHWHLWTDEDPQASLADAMRQLGSAGHTRIDWTKLAASERARAFVEAANALRPTVIFMQLQSPDALSIDAIKAVRQAKQRDPSLVVCTWSGDVGPGKGPWFGMSDEWQVRTARQVDLALFTGTGQVEILRERGVRNAAYLQIGYDIDRYYPGLEQDYGRKHVGVFLGNDYGNAYVSVPHQESGLRREMVARMKKAIPGFAAYGGGFGRSAHQRDVGGIYRGSLFAVSVSLTSKLGRYTSDRMIRAMACGTTTFVKRFDDMAGMGLVEDHNVLGWDTLDELVGSVRSWLEPAKRERLREIGRAGAGLMRTRHTWQYRIGELAALLATVRGQRWRDEH